MGGLPGRGTRLYLTIRVEVFFPSLVVFNPDLFRNVSYQEARPGTEVLVRIRLNLYLPKKGGNRRSYCNVQRLSRASGILESCIINLTYKRRSDILRYNEVREPR